MSSKRNTTSELINSIRQMLLHEPLSIHEINKNLGYIERSSSYTTMKRLVSSGHVVIAGKKSNNKKHMIQTYKWAQGKPAPVNFQDKLNKKNLHSECNAPRRDPLISALFS